MASTKEYLDFVLEQLSGLDEIGYRAMMGEYSEFLQVQRVWETFQQVASRRRYIPMPCLRKRTGYHRCPACEE